MKLGIATVISVGLLSTSAYAIENTTTTTTSTDAQMTSQTTNNQGAAFLAENKTKPGVVTLADGLQYKILKQGNGQKPTANDTVKVNYEGRLINGTVFDSSYKRGEPASFPVNAVIAGWVEALQLMTVGSTWELYIPASLAYGAAGAPPAIGPNETLIFKVELLDVSKA